ncbi:hypothetical protein GCM10012275_29740 [Longimycelium tulufanense]|uniref:Glycosyltransferase RgtA/B/C/D-like domain-containing protein n=1 Tax=Longimycelium tulufanense TaxID=907463 RepID=A0A8J3C8L9_9PSEU|nr:glycosyltransferase family 39 protein [Longimycelium tulufanense]GGM56628.1 hypothetical protein GCM10012275_29740 [Longimycelium tulufanense]
MTAVLTKPSSTRPTPPPRPRRRPRSPNDTLLITALLVLSLPALAWNITRFPGIGTDEGTYLAQAWAVREGVGLTHYTYWYDHPPLGWIQLALLSWLPDLLGSDGLVVANGRLVMVVVGLVANALLYLLARRMALPRWAAALAVIVFTWSPLAVVLHRQIYLDNVAVVWILAAFVLALSPRRHLWHHITAGACTAVSLLSKETMAVAVPAVLLALRQGTHPSTRKFSFAGYCAGLVLVLVFYPLYALLKGELFAGQGHVSLLGALRFQLVGRAGSGSVFTEGSAAQQTVSIWFQYDAVLIIVGLVGAAVGLAVRRLRPAALAAVLLVLVALRPNGYLPAMYVVQALPFLALLLAGTAFLVTEVVRKRLLRYRSPSVRVAGAALLCGAMTAGIAITPSWYTANASTFTSAANDDYLAAASWLRKHPPADHGERIVVDDALWLDAVRAGYAPGLGAIWFYKLDLDPAVRAALPGGWQDLDLVVSTPMMRANTRGLPTVTAALQHSYVIVTFGTGPDRVEIRRVQQNERKGAR